MRRLLVPVIFILTCLAAMGSSAMAGGWWTYIGPEDQYIGIREKVHFRVSDIFFRSIEDARRADQEEYYAYLVHGFDKSRLERAMSRPQPGRWWEPPAHIVKVGRVELLDWNGNLADARVHLDIPKIAPDSYHLMLCNEDCRRPLANVIPARVQVTTDRVAAQTSRRLHETRERLRLALARIRHDIREGQHALQLAMEEATRATEAVALLKQSRSNRRPELSPWIAYLGWLLGSAALGLLVRRRQVRTPPPSLEGWVPDTPRQLIETR
jgi:hypothetical protein